MLESKVRKNCNSIVVNAVDEKPLKGEKKNFVAGEVREYLKKYRSWRTPKKQILKGIVRRRM